MPLNRRWRGLVDALLAPAEDPRVTYADGVERQQALIAQMRRALARVGEARERLEARALATRDALPALEEQAREALRCGQEERARRWLERRQAAAAELGALEAQLAQVALEEERLLALEGRLAAQLDAWLARREIAVARLSAAEAQAGIGETLAGAGADLGDLRSALVQTEEWADYLQARATAIQGLVSAGVFDPLGGELLPDRSRPADDEIERQLAALRCELDAEAW